MKNSIIPLPVIEAEVINMNTESLTSFPTIRMSKRIVIIGVVCTVAVVFSMFWLLVPKARSESMQIPPEAWDLAKMIQAKSEAHAAKEKELQPILDQIAKLEAQRDSKLGEMSKLAGGAAGLDHTLCAEYGLKYVRGSGKKVGSFQNTHDCPLE